MSDASTLHLDLALHPDDAARLGRSGGFLGGKPPTGATRRASLSIVWHDTPDGALAQTGLSLAERRMGRETTWRLERLHPHGAAAEAIPDGTAWVPGTPPPLLASADSLEALQHARPHMLPTGLSPVAGLDGQVRSLGGGAVTVVVLTGELRAVAGTRQVCRLAIEGEPDAALALACKLATTLRLAVPGAPLACDALALARGRTPEGRSGPPVLSPSDTVSGAFAGAVAHLEGVILRHARAVAVGTPEPVHQMRVALRRLRSIAKLFARVAACPELDAAGAGLRALGQALGPARDWDVFCGGTAHDVAAAFEGEPSIVRLAAAAGRKREAAYGVLLAYLDSPEYRQLGLMLTGLAATQPWLRPPATPAPTRSDAEPGDDAAPTNPVHPTQTPRDTGAALAANRSAADLRHFAARALSKRHKRLFAAGRDIAGLPAAELHAVRLDGKRMRYAAELFAPLFPGRDTSRFLRRLAALQERLGHLNDGAVAASLVAALGLSGRFAGGCVRGFVAAGAGGSRAEIDAAWRKLRRQDPFWS